MVISLICTYTAASAAATSASVSFSRLYFVLNFYRCVAVLRIRCCCCCFRGVRALKISTLKKCLDSFMLAIARHHTVSRRPNYLFFFFISFTHSLHSGVHKHTRARGTHTHTHHTRNDGSSNYIQLRSPQPDYNSYHRVVRTHTHTHCVCKFV